MRIVFFRKIKSLLGKPILFAIILLGILTYVKLALDHKCEDTSTDKRKLDLKELKLPQLTYRQDLGVIMEILRGEMMIEIGVGSGVFSYDILAKWPSFKKYYGIDPWTQQANYRESSNVDNKTHSKNFEKAQKRLKIFGNRINLIKKFSAQAVDQFSDQTIDLVFLGGRHDYCAVMENLKFYYPKLKCGGFMAGCDYLTIDEQRKISKKEDYGMCVNGERVLKSGGAVKGAVIDFSKEYNITEISLINETWPSFYFMKKC